MVHNIYGLSSRRSAPKPSGCAKPPGTSPETRYSSLGGDRDFFCGTALSLTEKVRRRRPGEILLLCRQAFSPEMSFAVAATRMYANVYLFARDAAPGEVRMPRPWSEQPARSSRIDATVDNLHHPDDAVTAAQSGGQPETRDG